MQKAMHIGMLCDRLHCLPSQVLQEDSYAIWLLTVYFDAVAEKEKKDQEEQERRSKQTGKTPRRR